MLLLYVPRWTFCHVEFWRYQMFGWRHSEFKYDTWLKSPLPHCDCVWRVCFFSRSCLLYCFYHSPGVWQWTPALPKRRGVCQQRPLQLSLSLHWLAVREAPVWVGARRLQGCRFRPGCPDASLLPRAAAAAPGLSAPKRGLMPGHRALKGPSTWWEWWILHGDLPTISSPFQNNQPLNKSSNELDWTSCFASRALWTLALMMNGMCQTRVQKLLI